MEKIGFEIGFVLTPPGSIATKIQSCPKLQMTYMSNLPFMGSDVFVIRQCNVCTFFIRLFDVPELGAGHCGWQPQQYDDLKRLDVECLEIIDVFLCHRDNLF